ncbi:hydroxyethylthiazole kinase [Natranaerobius thermophilus]|uniref:Hydroxyethylthiazole kinase n=1 Tax=Natranaerobius thermophilus (strain ATCC BAA-1301 / DSM 18059 / JW/NM-WN-LF) TaxID=457570 RepID=THIM_NATTJ|nr:hydroxyethylthiazole kinase [Natranaerobius thermophilus]B2A1A8.1 RecName: Full=Hydroxyethylthiazole kinase; AltName: Full=4-methyl-5-beta-hydroxyethylthiazole kinase; Short=TH kinase; Short=Thz kinase [Natranaerobius thermophilus JW/NM-WN-LF]ACB86046.1 Hydroxyethylthiazole kinase [Natranaerobius thermophilus JW/NM-WN-LF]
MSTFNSNFKLGTYLTQVRQENPLVHAITNYVTMNDCANITLAAGASPAMCESRDEVSDFVPLAKALYINIGTINQEHKDSIYLAAEKASELEIPIVLDPVGAVAIKSRLDLVKDLLTNYNVSCIKGNNAEIKCLAGRKGHGKGMDSLDLGEDIQMVNSELSEKYNTMVLATGKTDLITKGNITVKVSNGTPLLGRITGSGCMLGILISAFIGASDNDWEAGIAATVSMGVVGEMAEESISSSTDLGSFRVKIFDHMAALTSKELQERGNVSEL